MKRKTIGALAFGVMAALSGAAQAVLLTQGGLTTNIRADNGAIDNLQFLGNEYYELGFHASDYGFQNGTATGTFRANDTSGGTGAPSSAVGGGTTATVTGNVGFDTGILFTRTYSLLNGNAVKIETTVTNTTGAALTIRLFDTLDPDQLTTTTVNDVFNASGARIGTSIDTGGIRAVAFASNQAGAIIGYGDTFGLAITSGTALNAFFGAPFDPGGAAGDIGVGIGIEELLSAGEVFTFTYVQGYGTTNDAATDAALGALVPEPATLALLGLGLFGAGFARRRQQGRG